MRVLSKERFEELTKHLERRISQSPNSFPSFRYIGPVPRDVVALRRLVEDLAEISLSQECDIYRLSDMTVLRELKGSELFS